MERDDAYFTNLLNNGVYEETFEDISATPVELEHTPPIKDNNPSSKPLQKQKGKNFTEDEDRLLVAAWLNVSTDPVQGTNQTKATFWTRVYRFYDMDRGVFAERNANSLLHRWSAIQEAVSKFCACLTQIEGRNQSGMTVHDRVEQAEILFKSQDPKDKPFQFRHCWLQLRNQPKWHDKLAQLAASKTSNKKQKTTKNSSPGTIDLTTQEGNEDPSPETAIPETSTPQRPIGKKKAKESLRRGSSAACTETLDILWAKKREADAEKELKRDERYAKAYALDKERLELDKERHALEKERIQNEKDTIFLRRIAEEQKIMTIDLSSMNELQQQYYMSLQAEIMARRMN